MRGIENPPVMRPYYDASDALKSNCDTTDRSGECGRYTREWRSVRGRDSDKGERMVKRFSLFVMATASLFAEHVYIGTSGKGIYLADFDAKTGKLSAPEMVSDTAAPSYLTIHEGHLYAVNEVKDGAVSSFTIDRSSGKLTPLNSMSVKSAGPCYIAIDKSGHSAITANYSGGSITVLPIGSDGRLGEATDFIQHKGSGPNRDHQTMPHPHWVGFIPASKLALIADLGIDEVGIYNFDSKKGKLTVGNPA